MNNPEKDSRDIPPGNNSIKLLKYISASGLMSRRDSFNLIKDGFVAVNSTIVTEPSYLVNEKDIVTAKGRKLTREEHVYIMLNKPAGYTCTSSDPHADKKAIDLIKCQYRVFNVGRLDKDSEGLLIFTNDGDYANKLIHPSASVLKRYEVTLSGLIPRHKLNELVKGIYDDGELLKAHEVKPITERKYLFTLGEGKKREIRRMAAFAELKVLKLVRISIGSLKLGNLQSGRWKLMSNEEITLSLSSSTNPLKKRI